MKKILLVIALYLMTPIGAWAQCNGIFPPNTLCGNLGASPAPPEAFSASSSIIGPGSSTIGDIATWANTGGSQLADTPPLQIFGTQSANTFLAGPSTGSPAFSSFRTIVPADLPIGTNSLLGALRCDGTSTTCSGGIITATATASPPGGSNTQLQFNNSGVFGGASTLTYASNTLTDTFNGLSSFLIQDAASSPNAINFGVVTSTTIPSPPFTPSSGTLAVSTFNPHLTAGQSMYDITVTNGVLYLAGTDSDATNPYLAIGGAGTNCCWIPALGSQPGFQFSYGQQIVQAYPPAPGPLNFNVVNFGLNTGSNARDVHMQIFSGEDAATHAQPGLFFWLTNGTPGNSGYTPGNTGITAGDTIGELAGFGGATTGYTQNEISEIRFVPDQNCTNTGSGSPIASDTTCGGNLVMFASADGGNNTLVVGGFFADSVGGANSGATLAVGNWALAGNGFKGGSGTITIKNNGSVPGSATTNGGVIYVTSGALTYMSPAGTVTTIAPN